MAEAVDVVLLSRDTIVREGLWRILAKEEFVIRQSAAETAELESGECSRTGTLIIMDTSAGQYRDELASLKSRFPQSRIVVLSDSFNFEHMVGAFRSGAHGYIIKEISCSPLIASLRLVAMGEKVMPSDLADILPGHTLEFGGVDTERTLELAGLTDREVEILQCLIMGCPNKVISRMLEISEATVKVHVKAVLRKLGVQNRTQAAIWAVNRGIEGFGLNDREDIDESDLVEAEPLPRRLAVDTRSFAVA